MAAILISEFMFGAHDVLVPLSGAGVVTGVKIGEHQRGSGSLYEHPLTVDEASIAMAGWNEWQRDRREWHLNALATPPLIVLDEGMGSTSEWHARPNGTFHLADFPGGIELLAYVRVDGGRR